MSIALETAPTRDVTLLAPDLRPGEELRVVRSPAKKRPDLFIAVFAAWAIATAFLHPRLWSLTSLAHDPLGFASIAFFVVFAELAWLYGFYNIGIVAFAAIDRRFFSGRHLSAAQAYAESPTDTPVAVLYTTCNDFVEASAQSCVELEYPNFTVYILDDSSTPEYRARVDQFAARNPYRVRVIRRAERRGAKAGNLNHALSGIVQEPLFAVVDADEIVPTDFLSKLAARIEADPRCAFVQANHRANPHAGTKLARDMGVGIDIHWKWYQPLRNTFGFVMFLGHGALIRRAAWEETGGFPEIVSEDLAFAIAAREKGWHGFFAEDVVCFEEFPETVRAFRVRHVKWTRGTCEFLRAFALRLVRARNVTVAEKIDILFPTLNLPLTFFFFLFMINAQFALPAILGQMRPLTLALAGHEFVVPVLTLNEDVGAIFGIDFYAITLMTVVAPILCFIVELWRRPAVLLRFLAHSSALYAALSPLSFVSVLGYAITGKARFLVTGDAAGNGMIANAASRLGARAMQYFGETHPDHVATRTFEVLIGAAFLACALAMVQVSFIGVAIGFMLLPLMHAIGWDDPRVQRLKFAPVRVRPRGAWRWRAGRVRASAGLLRVRLPLLDPPFSRARTASRGSASSRGCSPSGQDTPRSAR